jgi:hypothetical protein
MKQAYLLVYFIHSGHKTLMMGSELAGSYNVNEASSNKKFNFIYKKIKLNNIQELCLNFRLNLLFKYYPKIWCDLLEYLVSRTKGLQIWGHRRGGGGGEPANKITK